MVQELEEISKKVETQYGELAKIQGQLDLGELDESGKNTFLGEMLWFSKFDLNSSIFAISRCSTIQLYAIEKLAQFNLVSGLIIRPCLYGNTC